MPPPQPLLRKLDGIYYVASGTINITDPLATFPETYSITGIDMRGVAVLPNGALTIKPAVKRIASLPRTALPNGVALSRPKSDYLLVADTFRGLIWNVNIRYGSVGVALEDATTKVANGLKVWNGSMYWTSTGLGSFFCIPIDERGNVLPGPILVLVASNLTCDDSVVDERGEIYVAGPLDVLTKVS